MVKIGQDMVNVVFECPLNLSIMNTCSIKDLSRVKSGFKSAPLQLYFEITGLASALKSGFYSAKIFKNILLVLVYAYKLTSFYYNTYTL